MNFKIIGGISDIEVIAGGRAVRVRRHPDKKYGRSHWRKLKGIALVELAYRRVSRG